jgi:hypothetical protein
MSQIWKLFQRKKSESIREAVEKEITNPPFMGFGHAHAYKIPLNNRTDFVKAYLAIPQLNFIINSLATNWSRGKFRLHKIQTNGKKVEIFQDPLIDFLKNPNPLQTGVEWMQQFYAYYNIDGNGYNYAGVSSNLLSVQGVSARNMQSIWALPSQYIDIILNRKNIYSATEKREIIKVYRLNWNGWIDFLPESIMHQNKITLDYANTLNIISDSPIKPLEKPLSNIHQSYLARGINLTEGKGIIASSPKAAKGELNVPLTNKEILENNERFEQYGLQPGMHRIWHLTSAMDFSKIGWSLQELQIPEGIEDDTGTIANQFQFPYELIQKKNSKFNDKKLATQALFDAKIIPDSMTFIQQLNGWIKLAEQRKELSYDFSDLPELQQDRKTFAEVSAINTKSILEVQTSVSKGTTSYEAGLQMIQDITNKSAEESAIYLPSKKEVQTQVQDNTISNNTTSISSNNGNGKGEKIDILMN